MLWLLIGLLLVAALVALGIVAYRRRHHLRVNHALVRRPVPRWLIYGWLSGLSGLSAAVVVAQAIDRYTGKHTMTWFHVPQHQLDLAFGLAIATFIESLRRLWRRVTAKTLSEMRAKVRNQLGTAIASTCAINKVDVKPGELGCGLFLVRRHWFGPPTLRRVERLRLLDTLEDSGLVYSTGKGTVGKCWEGNTREYHSWIEVNKRYAANRPNQERWAKMKEVTRHGFTYREWTTMLGRYAEVLAVPINIKGTFVGCLALDRRWDMDDPDSPECLKSAAVQEAVGAVARALEPVLQG